MNEAHRWISSFEFARTFTWEIEHHWDEISDTLLACDDVHAIVVDRAFCEVVVVVDAGLLAVPMRAIFCLRIVGRIPEPA